MVGGFVLLVAGILIALFPALLSIIVASLLMGLGIVWITIAYHHRRLRRQFGFMDQDDTFRNGPGRNARGPNGSSPIDFFLRF